MVSIEKRDICIQLMIEICCVVIQKQVFSFMGYVLSSLNHDLTLCDDISVDRSRQFKDTQSLFHLCELYVN